MVAGITVIVVILLAVLCAWYLTNSSATYAGTPEAITIGNTPNENPALIYIALDKGYFSRNGLNVTIRDYPSGIAAIHALENGETDISESTEFNVAGEALNKENISMIASIDKFNTAFILCRKDSGIENVSDLKGKKIGVTRGVALEFFLGRFLDLHGMSINDVTLVGIPSSQYVESITNGSIDALVSTLYIDQIQTRLGSNLISWLVQSSQPSNWAITCREDWAANHPEQINRLLKSLVQAEDFTSAHPAEAKAIIQKRFNYTDAYMATIWPEHHFSLSLDQSLVLAMEDEGRWMIANDLTTEKEIPDFLDYIYAEGLKEEKPEAVNIIE
jgi:NitT/TauT family transport system substrate-binding protein